MNDQKLRLILILIGLTIATVDLKFQNVDVTPDVLGYVLIAYGLSGLLTMSKQMSIALASVILIAVLHLNQLFGVVRGMWSGLAMTVLNCIFFWTFLGGLGEYLKRINREDLADQAAIERFAYVSLASIGVGLGLLGQLGLPIGSLKVLVGIAIWVVVLLVLYLIFRTIKALKN